MFADKRDNALSEVTGMLLILAIIAVAKFMSLDMVPEMRKSAESHHMNDMRASFLELSYLVDPLWVNNQVTVPVTVPVALRTSMEPSAIPLFVPISSDGMLSITDVGEISDTFTVTFRGIRSTKSRIITWFGMFERVCTTQDACDCCILSSTPTPCIPGQVTVSRTMVNDFWCNIKKSM